MIETIQQIFDLGREEIVNGELFTPNDAHIVLSIYDQLEPENQKRIVNELTPQNMKAICYDIWERLKGQIV